MTMFGFFDSALLLRVLTAVKRAEADLVALTDMLAVWQERRATRRLLLEFDDRLLRDVGLTRDEATAEAQKPFWQI